MRHLPSYILAFSVIALLSPGICQADVATTQPALTDQQKIDLRLYQTKCHDSRELTDQFLAFTKTENDEVVSGISLDAVLSAPSHDEFMKKYDDRKHELQNWFEEYGAKYPKSDFPKMYADPELDRENAEYQKAHPAAAAAAAAAAPVAAATTAPSPTPYIGLSAMSTQEARREAHEKNIEVPPLPTVDGLIVYKIDDNSPCAEAGLQSGDVIVRINGKSVPHNGDFEAWFAHAVIGHSYKIIYLRVGDNGWQRSETSIVPVDKLVHEHQEAGSGTSN